MRQYAYNKKNFMITYLSELHKALEKMYSYLLDIQ